MNRREADRILRDLDRQGVWIFDTETMSQVSGETNRAYLSLSLKRLAEAGIIERVTRGIYFNPNARSTPSDPLRAVIPFLRPREISYVSLESVLSDASIISQAANTLTCMTSGAPGQIATPWGNVEFTRTRVPVEFGVDVYFSADGIPVATVAKAYQDLQRVGRNLELVDQEALEEALADEAQYGNDEDDDVKSPTF